MQHVDRVWGAAAAAQGDSLARALGTLAARRGGGELTCRSLGGGGTVSARVWALAPGVAEVMVRQDSAGSVRLEAVAGTYRACHSRPTA